MNKSYVSMKSNAEVIKSKETTKLQKRLLNNKEYNTNITKDIPSAILNGNTLDGNIIVRAFKFEALQDNDGKLLEPKWKAFETEGGKWAAKIENVEYSSRALVIKKPSQDFIKSLDNKSQEYRYDQLKELETVVWLSLRTLDSDMYVFLDDREVPVVNFNGYYSIPLSAIQLVENK